MSVAASRIMRSAARSLAWASASGKAMPWFLPIGRPNTTRSLAYATARRSDAWPMPTASAAIRMRSALSPSSRYWKPRPSSPTRSASGTSTSSYVVSHEATALRPIFGIARRLDAVGVAVDEEQRHPLRRLGALLERCRAGQQQDAVGLQRLRRPHLAPVDDVVVAVAHGPGRDVGRVGAGIGLGHAERDVQLAGGDVGQVLLLHLLGAVDDDRVHAEHGEVQRRRAVHAGARRGDLARARSPPPGCPARRRRSARGWRCRSSPPAAIAS